MANCILKMINKILNQIKPNQIFVSFNGDKKALSELDSNQRYNLTLLTENSEIPFVDDFDFDSLYQELYGLIFKNN